MIEHDQFDKNVKKIKDKFNNYFGAKKDRESTVNDNVQVS